MIRLAGILTGSAMAVAFLIVALGFPEFDVRQDTPASPPQGIVQDDPLPEPEPAAAMETAPGSAAATDDAAVTPPETLAAAVPEPLEPEPLESEPPEVLEEIVPPRQPRTIAAATPGPAATEPRWYAFWSPFRSELAADGFVAQLQRTTGLDYRVVKLEPGVYEVAFAYSDDADIESKLTQISSATGLDLSGG